MTICRTRFTLTDSTRSSRHPHSRSTPLRLDTYTPMTPLRLTGFMGSPSITDKELSYWGLPTLIAFSDLPSVRCGAQWDLLQKKPGPVRCPVGPGLSPEGIMPASVFNKMKVEAIATVRSRKEMIPKAVAKIGSVVDQWLRDKVNQATWDKNLAIFPHGKKCLSQ